MLQYLNDEMNTLNCCLLFSVHAALCACNACMESSVVTACMSIHVGQLIIQNFAVVLSF